MFGFITINRTDLSDGEFDRYLQVYCGQCHALGARLGQHTRLALSHDMTVMALLHMALYEPTETLQTSGCPLHPIKKRTWTSNPYVDYAGDMTVALMYHKLADDIADDQSKKAAIAARVLKNAYADVAKRWPRQCAAIEMGLKNITEIENRHCALRVTNNAAHAADNTTNATHAKDFDGDFGADADEAANIFGIIMGEIFAVHDDFWARDLRVLGSQLGRFIYMMDAAVDLEDDLKDGSFNPFAGRGFEPEAIRDLLMLYMHDVCEVFERLPIEQDVHILRNVFYSGVWGQYNKKVGIAADETNDKVPDEMCEQSPDEMCEETIDG